MLCIFVFILLQFLFLSWEGVFFGRICIVDVVQIDAFGRVFHDAAMLMIFHPGAPIGFWYHFWRREPCGTITLRGPALIGDFSWFPPGAEPRMLRGMSVLRGAMKGCCSGEGIRIPPVMCRCQMVTQRLPRSLGGAFFGAFFSREILGGSCCVGSPRAKIVMSCHCGLTVGSNPQKIRQFSSLPPTGCNSQQLDSLATEIGRLNQYHPHAPWP